MGVGHGLIGKIFQFAVAKPAPAGRAVFGTGAPPVDLAARDEDAPVVAPPAARLVEPRQVLDDVGHFAHRLQSRRLVHHERDAVADDEHLVNLVLAAREHDDALRPGGINRPHDARRIAAIAGGAREVRDAHVPKPRALRGEANRGNRRKECCFCFHIFPPQDFAAFLNRRATCPPHLTHYSTII